jgi:hypothetical protein
MVRARLARNCPRRRVSMSTLVEVHAAVAARLTTLAAEAAKLGISRRALSSAMRNEGLTTLKHVTGPREFSPLRRCTARGWPPVTGDLEAWNKEIRPGWRCHRATPWT